MRQPAPAFQTLEITEQYSQALAALTKETRKQAIARAKMLFDNPAHPSLKAHSVKPGKYFWEAYVNRGDRIIYIPEGSHLVLVDIVAHDTSAATAIARRTRSGEAALVLRPVVSTGSSLLLCAPTAPAGRLQHQPVAGLDLRAVHRTQLQHLAVRADHALAAGGAG